MNYFLTLISILLETTKNIFSNHFSKAILQNKTDTYLFNGFLSAGSFLILLFMVRDVHISRFSIYLAVLFAVVTALSQFFYLQALKHGSMAYGTFFAGCGMIIPILCGILFWNEAVKLNQIIALPILTLCMAMTLLDKAIKPSVKWLTYSILTLLFTGGIGVVQSMHQASQYKNELIGFLVISFLLMVIFNFLLCFLSSRFSEKATYKANSRVTLIAIISGAIMGVVNVLNLHLAGVMPKTIFFSLVNGGLIFVSLLAAVILFKEKLSIKQWIGMALGIISLCLLSI